MKLLNKARAFALFIVAALLITAAGCNKGSDTAEKAEFRLENGYGFEFACIGGGHPFRESWRPILITDRTHLDMFFELFPMLEKRWNGANIDDNWLDKYDESFFETSYIAAFAFEGLSSEQQPALKNIEKTSTSIHITVDGANDAGYGFYAVYPYLCFVSLDRDIYPPESDFTILDETGMH